MAFGDELRVAVDVRQNAIQQFGALDDSLADLLPFRAGNEKRQAAQRPCALARFAVDPVRDAHVADTPVGGREALVDLLLPDAAQRCQIAQPMAARRTVRADEFVWNSG